jgi:hypothetical protein
MVFAFYGVTDHPCSPDFATRRSSCASAHFTISTIASITFWISRLTRSTRPPISRWPHSRRAAEPGSPFHPQSVGFPSEFAAEPLEEVFAHQLVLKRSQHAFLDFSSGGIVSSLVHVHGRGRREGLEVIARVDDVATPKL